MNLFRLALFLSFAAAGNRDARGVADIGSVVLRRSLGA